MASGPNIGAVRGYSVVTDPSRFSNFPKKRYRNSVKPELLLFKNQSNSSGSTIYSQSIAINPAEGFTVFVDPNTIGNVIIETAINPESGFWNILHTVSNGGYYSNNEKLSFLRVGLVDGINETTVWLYRQYSTY